MYALDLGGDETAIVTAPELLSTEDQRQWIVQDVMTSGGLYTVSGPVEPSVITGVVLDLAIAIASGRPALADLTCVREPVAYLHFSKSADVLKSLVRDRDTGADLAQLHLAAPSRDSVLAPGQVVAAELADGGVLVLDGLSEEQVKQTPEGRMSWLARVCASMPPTITTIAVLPPGPTASRAKRALDARGHFDLAKKKGSLRLSVTGRDVEDSRFDYFGGWSRATADILVSDEEHNVIEYLRQAEKQDNSPAAIARAIGANNHFDFNKRLQRLAKSGAILHRGHSAYSHPDWTAPDASAAETDDGQTAVHEEATVASLARDVLDLEARADEKEDATT